MEFIKEYPIDKLKIWDKNPRKNDKAAYKLMAVIEEYGFINPIIIDKDGIIRAGHARLKAAQQLNKDTVPVLIYNFQSEAQAIGYAIADNKLSEVAEWDFEKLDELMQELENSGFDTLLTGFDILELEHKFSENNQEINIDLMDDEMKFTFSVTPEQYEFVVQRLNGFDEDQNKAFLKALGYEI